MRIFLFLLFPSLFFFIGCQAKTQLGDSHQQIDINTPIITGSYNTNTTSCDFVSTKQFDDNGNVEGCKFDQNCTGNVRTSDFIPFYDKDFNKKCVHPEEELDGEEDELTTEEAIDQLNDGVLKTK